MKESIVRKRNIRDIIFNIRSLQVMIDEELAQLYGVETRYLNRAVKRNIGRFSGKVSFSNYSGGV